MKQIQDPDIEQCPTSQRYCDKTILSENITVHVMKMWNLKKCIRANKTVESSEKGFVFFVFFFGTLGTHAKGKETASYLVM